MGTPLKTRQPCPFENCGSSDAYHTYEDEKFGHQYGYCYSCGQSHKLTEGTKMSTESVLVSAFNPKEHDSPFGPLRGIRLDTLNRFGIKVDCDYSTGARKLKAVVFPYKTSGVLTAEKFDLVTQRDGKRKVMPIDHAPSWSANEDMDLFLMDHWPKGGRTVTILEGEYDTLSHIQMMGNYPAVSIPSGADKKLNFLKNKRNYEFLSSFETIMICFDNDEPGQEAAVALANTFAGKAKIVHLKGPDDDPAKSRKDANDYLRASDIEAYNKLWWAAYNTAPWSPSDILFGSSFIDEVLSDEKEEFIPYPYEELNKLVYGMHTPEVVLVTAFPKVGKSTITGALVAHLLTTQDGPVGDISLEDTPKRRMRTLLSLATQKPLHLPEVWELADKEMLKSIAVKTGIASDRYVAYSNADTDLYGGIIDRVRYMVTVIGCKYIIFDHISFIASFHSATLDERKSLDQLSNKLTSMAKELDFCLIVVAHLNREGKVHGSSNLEKVCWVHIELDRDKEHADPCARNIVKVVVKLNRRYGRTGHFYLEYKEDPYGMFEIATEKAEKILGIEKE